MGLSGFGQLFFDCLGMSLFFIEKFFADSLEILIYYGRMGVIGRNSRKGGCKADLRVHNRCRED